MVDPFVEIERGAKRVFQCERTALEARRSRAIGLILPAKSVSWLASLILHPLPKSPWWALLLIWAMAQMLSRSRCGMNAHSGGTAPEFHRFPLWLEVGFIHIVKETKTGHTSQYVSSDLSVNRIE
jgi:hypothetical protein